MSLRENISQAIVNHVLNRYGNRIVYANKILEAVKDLLHNHLDDYNFPQNLKNQPQLPKTKEDDFQELLSKINEKEARRKKEGVYLELMVRKM